MKTTYGLIKSLNKLGLNQSEQAVYLAGLDRGPLTSAELISLAKRPKPTVMAAIDSLKYYDLCLIKRRDGRSLTYTMQPPSAAKARVGSQIRQLDELTQSLDELSVITESTPVVREVTGQEGIKDLLELALRCQSRQWQIIAPRDNALAYMPKSYIDYFKRTRQQRKIESETLWDEKWQGKQLSLNDLISRKPRYVPKNLAKNIPCLMLAFDDKVLALEGTTEPTAVLVQSQAVAETFKLIFEMAWRSCRG